MATNKKIGNDFEAELCEILSSYGFWAHNLAQNQSGQPADVIAARNGIAYLIDCKVCTREGFDLRRVEDNQELSMMLWQDTGNGVGYFAIKIEDSIYMLDSLAVSHLSEDHTVLNLDLIHRYARPLDRWISVCA